MTTAVTRSRATAACRGLIAFVALAACSGERSVATPRDAVLEAWKADKLAPSALAAQTVAFGKDCQGGAVEGIEILVCNYPSPAEAKAAEDAGLGWVGQATGASQARGAALVVLADRKKADPSGKTMNRLLKLAPN
jgi:hypothetical protein